MTSPAEALNDAQLIDRVRADDATAFAELRHRHLSDAVRTARVAAHDPDEADRVVGTAFEHLHAALAAGHGPRTAVSPYLRTMVRRGALDAHRTPVGEHGAAELAAVDDLPRAADPLTDVEQRDITREAYESLPERWQRALWLTEIEGRTPASLVPDLGSATSAVAALAYRAREGLRQAYLAVHMSVAVSAECRPMVAALPAYVRDALSPEDDVTVAIHLDTCAACRNRRYELVLLVSNLRSVLAPALLGYRAGTPAATRPVVGRGGAAAAPVVTAARTTALAAVAAVGRWPQRTVKAAGTAAVCLLAAVALAWAASSAFAPPTPADASDGDREPLAVTFAQDGEQPPPATIDPLKLLDGLPAEANDEPEPADTRPGRDPVGQPSTSDTDEASGDEPAAEPATAADSADNTSGAEPADPGAAEPADDGSSGADAGDGGNQDPPDGSDPDPGQQQPVPPAGNDDGESGNDADEPADQPDGNPAEEEEQEETGLLELIICGLFPC